MNKNILCALILLIVNTFGFAQDYNQQKNDLSRFLERMYVANPFEGVKVFTDYENTYLLSVVALSADKYANTQTMNRVAGVKAMSQASNYFNGAHITSETIIKSTQNTDDALDIAIIEVITERGAGYVKQMELLSNFSIGSDNVFIYGIKTDTPVIEKKSGKKTKKNSK